MVEITGRIISRLIIELPQSTCSSQRSQAWLRREIRAVNGCRRYPRFVYQAIKRSGCIARIVTAGTDLCAGGSGARSKGRDLRSTKLPVDVDTKRGATVDPGNVVPDTSRDRRNAFDHVALKTILERVELKLASGQAQRVAAVKRTGN